MKSYNGKMPIYDSSEPTKFLVSQIIEIWARKDLLTLLVKRDLTVRYKRSIIGVWWSLLNPLFITLVLYYVFNTVFKAKLGTGQPFLPYLLSGVLMMSLFSQGLTGGAEAISSGAGVLTKIYVRPEIYALSTSSAAAVNFIIGLVPLTLTMFISGEIINYRFPIALLVIILLVIFTTSLSLLLSIAFIKFDDTKSIIQIILLALQYATPVFYPISALGPHTQTIINLNPLTSYLNLFRFYIGLDVPISWHNWVMVIVTSFGMFFVGFGMFKREWPMLVSRI